MFVACPSPAGLNELLLVARGPREGVPQEFLGLGASYVLLLILNQLVG